MPKYKINDLPQTTSLDNLDSLEVSKYNGNDRFSAHVNYETLRDNLESQLINNDSASKGMRFHHEEFGTGTYGSGSVQAPYLLNYPNTGNKCKYQVIDISLDSFASIPTNATHAELNINYNWVIANNNYSVYVFGVDSNVPASNVISDFDDMLTQVIVDPSWTSPTTQTKINQVMKQTFGSMGTSMPSHVNFVADKKIAINTGATNNKTVRIIIAITQALPGGYQIPANLTDITASGLFTYCKGWSI